MTPDALKYGLIDFCAEGRSAWSQHLRKIERRRYCLLLMEAGLLQRIDRLADDAASEIAEAEAMISNADRYLVFFFARSGPAVVRARRYGKWCAPRARITIPR
jgi:hypothetical protein